MRSWSTTRRLGRLESVQQGTSCVSEDRGQGVPPERDLGGYTVGRETADAHI